MRMKHGAKFLVAALCLAMLVTAAGCAGGGPSRTAVQSGAVGGAVGATAGALIDSDNRWRGGVIGGALGAVLGGALGEISSRASREAASRNQPVAYTNQAGTQRVEAVPGGRRGNCQMVTEKYYERGKLVREVQREVCN